MSHCRLTHAWWASTEEIAWEALAAVGLRARCAVATADHVYRTEVRDGQVVIQKTQARSVSNRR